MSSFFKEKGSLGINAMYLERDEIIEIPDQAAPYQIATPAHQCCTIYIRQTRTASTLIFFHHRRRNTKAGNCNEAGCSVKVRNGNVKWFDDSVKSEEYLSG